MPAGDIPTITRQLAYYRAHREEVLAAKAAQRAADPEKYRDRERAYRAANIENVRERERDAQRKRRITHKAHLDAQARARYAANPEPKKESARRYVASHPEDKARAQAAYRALHREEAVARTRAWVVANPSRRLDQQAGRRALKIAAFVESVSRQAVYERDEGVCGICHRPVSRRAFHLDHIIPLARGGEHSYANTQATHPRCNMKKHAHYEVVA